MANISDDNVSKLLGDDKIGKLQNIFGSYMV